MSWKNKLPLGIAVAVGIAATVLIATSILASDKNEELLHLYREYRAADRNRTATIAGASGGLEIQGRWRGLTVVPVDSLSARLAGVKEGERGVAVADAGGLPGQQAGLLPGDLITRVDGQPVRNISELYYVARKVGPAAPALIEVRRHEAPLTLVLPPAPGAAAGLGAGVEGGGLVPAAWGGSHFYCPRDRVVVAGTAAGPGYRCPHCQGFLQPYPGAGF